MKAPDGGCGSAKGAEQSAFMYGGTAIMPYAALL